MAKRRELITAGYIHEMQQMLSNDKIIPDEIIQTCYAYFAVPFFLFQVRNPVYPCKPYFNVFDPFSQIVNHLSPKAKSSISLRCHVYDVQSCYVPDISSIVKFKDEEIIDANKSYDAIIGFHSKKRYSGRRPPMHPHIFLFESKKIFEKNIEHYAFYSSQTLPSYTFSGLIQSRTINCGIKHGLIYEFENQLYQLKLQNINDLTNFNFTQIDAKNKCFNDKPRTWLGLGYIPNYYGHDKVFAIRNKSGIASMNGIPCGIFDLYTNKWQQLQSFEKATFDPLFSIANNNSNTSSVYTVMHHRKGQGDKPRIVTASIDLNKNKWVIINDDTKCKEQNYFHGLTRPIIWFDDNPNTLCYATGGNISYLDLRAKKMKWIEMDNIKSVYKQMSKGGFFV